MLRSPLWGTWDCRLLIRTRVLQHGMWELKITHINHHADRFALGTNRDEREQTNGRLSYKIRLWRKHTTTHGINTMVDKYEGYIVLLCTIPGVDRSSAITILSEIGVDMAQFGTSKRLCCWAGLTPGNNESAGKKKSVRISRAGVYLKPAQVQIAHAAVKDKSSPYYALKYERIAKRRGKKRAIIAIARMILTAVFVMLSNLEEWNPVDLYRVDMPEPLKEKQLAKAVKQAVRFLETQGIAVLDSA